MLIKQRGAYRRQYAYRRQRRQRRSEINSAGWQPQLWQLKQAPTDLTERVQLTSAGRLKEENRDVKSVLQRRSFFLRQPPALSREASWRPFQPRGGGSTGSDRRKGRDKRVEARSGMSRRVGRSGGMLWSERKAWWQMFLKRMHYGAKTLSHGSLSLHGRWFWRSKLRSSVLPTSNRKYFQSVLELLLVQFSCSSCR